MAARAAAPPSAHDHLNRGEDMPNGEQVNDIVNHFTAGNAERPSEAPAGIFSHARGIYPVIRRHP